MNNYLSYTSRDFNSIKEDLVSSISSLTNIWTNREQADPGMVLVTLMAALGDNLSFNMDKQSLEFFGRTVTQRKNAKYIFDLLGYKMHWYESAQLEVTISNLNQSQAINLLFNPTKKLNTQRLTSSSITSAPPYVLLNPRETPQNWNENVYDIIPPNSSRTYKAVQGTINSINFSSSSIDENNRFYLPISKIDQNHLWLQDSGNIYRWYLVDSIDKLTETLPRFEFDVDEFNMPYIEFVPYWRQFSGEDNTTLNFTLYYISTLGANGDVTDNVLNYVSNLSANNQQFALMDLQRNIAITHGTNAFYNDNINNIPGKNPENANEAYLSSKNLIGTYDTLVTLVDFEKFFRRLGLISNVLAIDGQRAMDLNENIAESFNKVLSEDSTISFISEFPTGTDIDTKLTYILLDSIDGYNAGAYQYINNTWVSIPSVDINGFKPYTCQMHMIAGDFLERNPLNYSEIYATSTPVVIEDASESYESGWLDYALSDAIIGKSSDSLVSQTNLDACKVISSNVTYGSIRKFPFYIDGVIHLKEPTTPANASIILRKVYMAIKSNFIAGNLVLGQKIPFSSIISIINSADSNISYFDAGANNTNGSLFIYPRADDLNPYVFDESGELQPYGIDINPKYFNPISLQHFEDIMYNNNQYLYWSKTASGHLSISPDSISNKTTPNLSNTSGIVSCQYLPDISTPEDPKYKYTCFIQFLPQGTKDLFEYNFVKELHTINESLDAMTQEPIYYYDEWQSSPEYFSEDLTESGGISIWYDSPYNEETQSFDPEILRPGKYAVIAYRFKETDTTTKSSSNFASGQLPPVDNNEE